MKRCPILSTGAAAAARRTNALAAVVEQASSLVQEQAGTLALRESSTTVAKSSLQGTIRLSLHPVPPRSLKRCRMAAWLPRLLHLE